ncbi:MAG: hypothetical protein NC133_04475, partial [Prevotella sp.]|nr:hypothetical protein [Prevotella sp.]
MGVAVVTACAVNIKPSNAAETATATPTLLDGASVEYTGQSQKIVTDLPAGMRYAISTASINPATVDAGKIVPSAYTALDYLQSTGTQYIDTGFYPSGNTRTVIDWQFNDIELIQQRMFGNNTDGYCDCFNYEIYLNSINAIAYCYNDDSGNWVNTKIPADTKRHIFDLNGFAKVIQIDNGDLLHSSLDYVSVNNCAITSLYIFYNNASQDERDDRCALANMYSCRIYEKGILQRDYVPVRRDSDGV